MGYFVGLSIKSVCSFCFVCVHSPIATFSQCSLFILAYFIQDEGTLVVLSHLSSVSSGIYEQSVFEVSTNPKQISQKQIR